MITVRLHDGADPFDVLRFDADAPRRVVLFAVGGGGDPGRHAPLLAALATRGCVVVAPRLERLASPHPTDDHLRLRARRLVRAFDAAPPGLPVAGVGHSLGATVLLALAGAATWTGPGVPLDIARNARLTRLALLAPATGFFQPPGALDGVTTPLQVWTGDRDGLTPPAQGALLHRALGGRLPVELREIAGAGHFSFMDEPPPQVAEPLPDRAAFLAALADEVGRFVSA